MATFFSIVEYIGLYGFAIYLMFYKQELSIIYFPALFFASQVITASIPAAYFYGTICLLLVVVLRNNLSFYRNNIYAVLLAVYFLILLPKSKDIEFIRPYVFSVIWLFILVPLISAVYQKYSREEIFKELTKSAFIILSLFILNVIFSTIYKYSPHEMYGITSGVMYGNIWAAGLNTLSFAIFVLLLKILENKNPIYIGVFVVSLLFILLSLRRSVMGISIFGVGIAALTLMTQKNAKTLFLFGSIAFAVGYVVINQTDFLSEFNDRVELRKLDDRALTEEKRYFEYELLYKDMFEYNAYSPWFGYELFNSWGNYGRGVLADRSLHGDIPSIAHSSGLIGVLLYLLMVFKAFRQAWGSAENYSDKLIIFFCVTAFLSYTLTGRYTEIASMTLMFLIILLPVAPREEEEEEEDEGVAEESQTETSVLAYE